MTPADLAQVAALEEEVFATQAWSPRLLRCELDAHVTRGDRRYVVAAQGQEVLAYAGAYLGDGAGEADLLVVATAPWARRRGLAGTLVTTLVDDARRAGCWSVLLEVRESNAVARRLYQSHGFEVIGRRRRYYADPQEDAVVMRLVLRETTGPVGAEVV
ncbi:ribosomal-protein-alanine N-acetyltransferase [Actinomyces sp. 2119]|uniref:ribosomal protein S18-alanine N-acetyltransferase n=1 Tax=Actinomyces sp. 2119 TaxID=2321393 RepID=UPI000E6C1BDD|nr:ribosomal protein S18-alanine N-acetyltransferase [Actinomyces sp. 2119]RJF40790.1 ribosomal-protein-alanine N-acetyltransferase [Actinomyces sp. 2119]